MLRDCAPGGARIPGFDRSTGELDVVMNLRQPIFDRVRGYVILLVGTVALGALAACGAKEDAAAAGAAPPPAAVTVAHPVAREVVQWDAYSGYLESPESVTVAARVSGLIVSAPFVEGSVVKKGEVLYEIDERPFKADLDARIADEQKAEAAQANTKLTYDRLVGLAKTQAVSQQDVDDAKGNLDQAIAQVASAKAAIET